MVKVNSEEFIEKSKDMVIEFYNTVIDGDYSLDSGSIDIVSFSSFDNDFKIILSTFDALLYRITYQSVVDVFVFDVFRLCSHQEYSDYYGK